MAKIFFKVLTALRQGWDSDFVPAESKTVRPGRFDPARLLPYIFLHLGCLAVIFVGWSWTAVSIAAALYLIRMFSITAFYHRYFSHRAFRTSRLTQFVFAVLGNTSMQRGPLWWAATHRHHHRHSDEEPDMHSPVQHGLLWSHIGWLTNPENFPTDYRKVKDFAVFPELVFLNRHNLLVPILFGIGLWGTGALLERFAPGLGTSGAQIFVWGFFISTVILLHATLFINSLAHVAGSRRFKTDDDSRNNLWLALFTLGEGWHNNHHRFAHAARQGFYWFEIDFTWYGLKLMEWTGLISDLRQVPDHVYEEAANNSAPAA